MLNNNICSFNQIIDKIKDIEDRWPNSGLLAAFIDDFSFKEVIESNKLNKEDIKYLLNKIDEYSEIQAFCKDLSLNTSLIKYTLNELVLIDNELLDRLCEIAEKDTGEEGFDAFEMIEYYHEDNEEVLKLNELNKKLYMLNTFDLNEDQKTSVIGILKNNEDALNKLKSIIENNLESNYDFGSLMMYLRKKEKKNLINI